jgi:hypothetical protein
MRGAPQVGFSATMRKINFRTSLDSLFLPTCFLTFEIRLQYSRNPARCQRTTVSGVTTRRDFFQSDHNRHAGTQKELVKRQECWPGLPALQYCELLTEAPNSPEVAFDVNESTGPTVLHTAARS